MDKLSELEEKFSRLWTECQSCQGSLHEEVICTRLLLVILLLLPLVLQFINHCTQYYYCSIYYIRQVSLSHLLEKLDKKNNYFKIWYPLLLLLLTLLLLFNPILLHLFLPLLEPMLLFSNLSQSLFINPWSQYYNCFVICSLYFYIVLYSLESNIQYCIYYCYCFHCSLIHNYSLYYCYLIH